MSTPGATPTFRFQQLASNLRDRSLADVGMERYAASGDTASLALTLSGSVGGPLSVDITARQVRINSGVLVEFWGEFAGSPGAFGVAFIDVPIGVFNSSPSQVHGVWRAEQLSTGNECHGLIVPYITGSGDTFRRIRFRYLSSNPGAPTDMGASAPWAWAGGDSIAGQFVALA